jgi:sulfur carrier protein
MIIQVNDVEKDLPQASSLHQAVQLLGLGEDKGIAVAVNYQVIPVAQWSAHSLNEGDKILIIRATQGG